MKGRNIKRLISKAKIGNDKAFDELINLVKTDIYRLAKSRLMNEDDTLDAMQESITSMYENICNLRNVDKFYNWMTIIVINACNDISKDKNRNLEEYNDEIIDKTYKNNNYSDNVDKLFLEEALKNLTEEERMLLMFYYSYGFTAKEIERRTGIKEATIRSKVLRAKNKLKEIYKEQEDD